MTNIVDTVFAAADPENRGDITRGRAALCEAWKVTNQALQGMRRKGYLPLDKAKDAAQRFNLRLRDLVRPDIRDAMEKDAGVPPAAPVEDSEPNLLDD